MSLLRLVSEYSYQDILEAYLDCRKHKSTTKAALWFKLNFEKELVKLLDEVNSGTYQIGSTQAFVITNPKVREVWAASFRDRIVHHLVCRDIMPFYQKRFIEDTYACLPERGTLAASLRAEKFCRSVTKNWSRVGYVLQVDIANYFMSIYRPILWDILRKDLGEDSLTSRLVKQIVFHDPTKNAYIVKNSDFSIVPYHKSLWNRPPGYGLPIGNLTSQWFSNIYLNEFDHFVKHTLKAKCYVRYVDDAVFMHTDRDKLWQWKDEVDNWLRTNRKLHLHPDKIHVSAIHNGIDFVGRRILPWRSVPRRMTVASANSAASIVCDMEDDERHIASVNSYLGLIRHSDAYRMRKHLCNTVTSHDGLGCDRLYTKVFRDRAKVA